MSLRLIPPGTPLKELKAIPRFPIRIGEEKGKEDEMERVRNELTERNSTQPIRTTAFLTRRLVIVSINIQKN